MNARRYYDDAYTTRFQARIRERLQAGQRPVVILDATYFYPASGGQPHDLGEIGGVAVVDVQTRESDGAVLHVLAAPLAAAAEVACQVDWARRFDHMQQHTGQHILTQAFVQTADAHTVGFHLSPDSVTIDLDKNLPAEQISAAETLANQIVQENRPVRARLIALDAAEAAPSGGREGVRVRKIPEKMYTDGLRVIDIDGFDVTACGGTHVAHTGEIGLIKVLKTERRGDKLRVEFRCGGRALRDYQQKNAIISTLSADLTCATSEIVAAITRLRDELKSAHTALRAASARLVEYDAAALLQNATEHNGLRLVKAAFENRAAAELRLLAARLTETPGVVALLGTAGDKAQIICARSTDATPDMNAPLKAALTLLGKARGGGRPDLAQGGGIPAGLAQVQAALDAAQMALW
ncbi:MAG: alanyl-tRNA editing protein [Chloroflexi bacterium]|nr:alanyl-tRNA editing protein [Chloroflexota bacterium]